MNFKIGKNFFKNLKLENLSQNFQKTQTSAETQKNDSLFNFTSSNNSDSLIQDILSEFQPEPSEVPTEAPEDENKNPYPVPVYTAVGEDDLYPVTNTAVNEEDLYPVTNTAVNEDDLYPVVNTAVDEDDLYPVTNTAVDKKDLVVNTAVDKHDIPMDVVYEDRGSEEVREKPRKERKSVDSVRTREFSAADKSDEVSESKSIIKDIMEGLE